MQVLTIVSVFGSFRNSWVVSVPYSLLFPNVSWGPIRDYARLQALGTAWRPRRMSFLSLCCLRSDPANSSECCGGADRPPRQEIRWLFPDKVVVFKLRPDIQGPEQENKTKALKWGRTCVLGTARRPVCLGAHEQGRTSQSELECEVWARLYILLRSYLFIWNAVGSKWMVLSRRLAYSGQ